MAGGGDGDGNIPHGRLLVKFAEAALGADDAALDEVRARVLAALGGAALVDAAAVIGMFDALDRVADATGIPLEPDKDADTAGLRAEIGIDAFAANKAG